MKKISPQMLKEVLEWDVKAWSHAVPFWEGSEIDPRGLSVLDLGSRGGGLSFYFAFHGAQVICSDLDGPPEEARELIEKHGLAAQVFFKKIDATAIELPDGSCDIVCFKSILGGIGRDGKSHEQETAIKEIFRVLKPGGTLFFAENLAASGIHRFLRRKFVRWGDSWNYLTREKLIMILSPFDELSLGCWGFFSAFGRNESQRSLLARVDSLIIPLIPNSQRYIAYGYATKPKTGYQNPAKAGG